MRINLRTLCAALLLCVPMGSFPQTLMHAPNCIKVPSDVVLAGLLQKEHLYLSIHQALESQDVQNFIQLSSKSQPGRSLVLCFGIFRIPNHGTRVVLWIPNDKSSHAKVAARLTTLLGASVRLGGCLKVTDHNGLPGDKLTFSMIEIADETTSLGRLAPSEDISRLYFDQFSNWLLKDGIALEENIVVRLKWFGIDHGLYITDLDFLRGFGENYLLRGVPRRE